MFDIRLSAEQREFRDLARKFAQDEIKPNAMALDREPDWEKRVPWELLKKGSQLGFRTFVLQEENGGSGLSDHLTSCLVAEELAAGEKVAERLEHGPTILPGARLGRGPARLLGEVEQEGLLGRAGLEHQVGLVELRLEASVGVDDGGVEVGGAVLEDDGGGLALFGLAYPFGSGCNHCMS